MAPPRLSQPALLHGNERKNHSRAHFCVPMLSQNTGSWKNPCLTSQLSQLQVPEKEKIWKPRALFFQSHFSCPQPGCSLSVRVSLSHTDFVSLETSLLNSSKHQPDWKRNSIKGKHHLVVQGGLCWEKLLEHVFLVSWRACLGFLNLFIIPYPLLCHGHG